MPKMPESEEKNKIEMTEKYSASGETSKTSTICLAYVTYEIHHFSNVGRQEETRLPKITPNPGQKKEEMRNKFTRVGRNSLCAVPTVSLPKLPQNPACPTGPKPATVTVKTRMVPDRKRTPNHPNQQNLSNLSKRPGSKCPAVIPTGLSPMLAQRPLPPISSKAPTVNVNTRKNLPIKHHMVQDKKVSSPSKSLPNSAKDTVNRGKSQNMFTDNEVVQTAATMKDQLSVPVLSESPFDMTKKTCSQMISDHTVQDLPAENDELDNTKAGQPFTDGSLSTNICEEDTTGKSLLKSGKDNKKYIDESQNTVFSEVFQKVSGDLYSLKMHIASWKAKYASSVNADEFVEKEIHQYLQTFFERCLAESSCDILKKKSSQTTPSTTSSEAPDDETARQSSGSPELTLTDDETMQAAATMKDQLSVPVLSENTPDTTKKTSTQTLSDQTVQDLPIENNELDRTNAGEPITDGSLSTNICKDNAEVVSAGSELESTDSESHDEKPKGKIGFQKFKKAVKKLFHKKKIATSEASDDESARQSSSSPESTLTDDEAMQAAATMKEQLSQPVMSENTPDMTKKASTQILSDQTVQDLPTEHDKLDNTKAGQPITDSSLSTDSCEEHSEDVSAGSELESMASESHDENPKGKTPFQKFKRAVKKLFPKKKIATGREVQSTDSESQDETPKRETRLPKLKRAVKKLFHKKKTSSSEAPDDESARQSSASPESTLTDDEAMQAATTIKEQLSQPVMSENTPDMTKKTSTQTLSDQTVQDLPTEHDKLDNTKAGQPITDSSLSTDSCEDPSENVSAGSELESMASESHDEKPKGKTPFQKFKRAVKKLFHKKKIATSDAPEDTPLTSNTFKTEAEGLAEDAKCSLNEEIDIEVIKKQFTEVCIDVLQYIRDSSVILSSQSNYHLPH